MDYFKITHFIFKNFNLILIFKKKNRPHILFFLLKFVKLQLLLKYHWKLGITLIISQISFFIFRKRLTSHRAVCWTEPGTTLLSKNWRRYQESEYKQPQKHFRLSFENPTSLPLLFNFKANAAQSSPLPFPSISWVCLWKLTPNMEQETEAYVSKAAALMACVLMTLSYVGILYAPTLILRLPPPASLKHYLIRRFICAAISSIISLIFSALILPVSFFPWNLSIQFLLLSSTGYWVAKKQRMISGGTFVIFTFQTYYAEFTLAINVACLSVYSWVLGISNS